MDLFQQGDVRDKLYAAASKNNVPQGGVTGAMFKAMFPHGAGNLLFGREPEPMPALDSPAGTALMAELASNMMVPGTTSPKSLAKMFDNAPSLPRAGLLSNPDAEAAMHVLSNFERDGAVKLFHGSRTPWSGGYFDLSKIGQQSRAGTEGYGAYWALSRDNAKRFGKNVYELNIDKRLFDQIIDFERKVSEQPDYVKKTLAAWVDESMSGLDTWRTAQEYLRANPLARTRGGLGEVVKRITPENTAALKDWAARNDAGNGYFTKLFFGDSDPRAMDLYMKYGGKYGHRQFSEILNDNGIIGATFNANRDLHVVDPTSKNVIIWDQPTLMGRGVEEWL